MDDESIIGCFKDVIEDGHNILDQREESLRLIDSTENALRGESWSSQKANRELSKLYNSVSQQRRQTIANERDDLIQLQSALLNR